MLIWFSRNSDEDRLQLSRQAMAGAVKNDPQLQAAMRSLGATGAVPDEEVAKKLPAAPKRPRYAVRRSTLKKPVKG